MKALDLPKSVVGWPKKIQRDESHPPEAYYAITDFLKQHVNSNNEAKFVVTGHSLGRALAILFPAILSLHDETLLLDRLEGVYTFEQPRVGDHEYADYMVEEELNKNYFLPWAMMSMMINAAWEIMRSFIIGFKYGPNYREGWLLRIFRIIGLAVPGLPNHLLQDYANAHHNSDLICVNLD
ncbi:triacylglycerol lipase OBL1-like [Prosopis cineraria]|uniref:triacylglycerol lipase OBL1-like n=1 Tax=Prosopis cineraria TaxID=364024 RepID=UPI0024102BC2|nr:triacylglycerol lipase OBL1-like [Prosopis cineraria]